MENPWLSFEHYTEDKAKQFKGRDDDIAHVTQMIRDSDISVLYAESGIGKSSLIDAGVTPRLREEGFFPIRIVLTEEIQNRLKKNSKDDSVSLKDDKGAFRIFSQVIHDKILNEIALRNVDRPSSMCFRLEPLSSDGDSRYEVLDQQLAADSLWWFLNTRKICCAGLEMSPVLLFDQFEEVLRLQPSSLVNSFFSLCEELSLRKIPDSCRLSIEESGLEESVPELPSDSPYKMLFSLREEFIGQIDYWSTQKHFIPSIRDNRYALRPLTYEQAESVILDQGVDTLNYIKDQIIQQAMDDGSSSISSIFLSVLCYEYYERAKTDEHGNKIPISSSSIDVDPNDIVRVFYRKMLRKSGVKSHRHIKIIEDALVDSSGDRRRIKVMKDKPLGKIGFVEHYQKMLSDNHLITITPTLEKDKSSEEEMTVEYIELIHDKVADIIYENRRSISQNKTRVYSRILLVLVALVLLGALTYFETHTRLRGLATQKSYTYYHGNFDQIEADSIVGNPQIVDVSVYPGHSWKGGGRSGELSVKNCKNLRSLHILGDNCNSLIIEDCPSLESLSFDDRINSVWEFESRGNPKLTVYLNDFLERFGGSLKDDWDDLLFSISPNNPALLWSDGVLWNVEYEEIGYLNHRDGNTTLFPEQLSTLDSLQTYVFPRHILKNARNSRIMVSAQGDTLRRVYYWSSLLDFCDEPFSSVGTIATEALSHLEGVEKIVFPSDRHMSLHSGISSCKNLRSVVWPEGDTLFLETNNLLDHCPKLDTVEFPDVVSIDCATHFFLNSRPKLVRLPKEIVGQRGSFDFWFESLRDSKILIPDSSLFSLKNGVLFYRDKYMGSNTNYHSYSDSVYVSDYGILFKKQQNQQMNLIALDIPQHSDYRKYVERAGRNGIDTASRVFRLENAYYINGSFIFPAGTERIGIYTNHFFPPINTYNYLVDWGEVREIEMPYAHPFLIDTNSFYRVINVLPLDIPASDRQHISLIVPPGTKEIFTSDIRLSSFKDIQEKSVCSFYFDLFVGELAGGLSTINTHLWMKIGGLLLLFIVASAFVYSQLKLKQSRSVSHAIIISVVSLLLFLLVWFLLYWPLFEIIWNLLGRFSIFTYTYHRITLTNSVLNVVIPVLCTIISAVVSYFFVHLLFSESFDLKKIIVTLRASRKEVWHKSRSVVQSMIVFLVSHKKWVIASALVICLIAFGVDSIVKRSRLLEEAQRLTETGNYSDAADLLAKYLPSHHGISKRSPRAITASILFQQSLLNESKHWGLTYDCCSSFMDFNNDYKLYTYDASADSMVVCKAHRQFVDAIGTYSGSDIQCSPTGKWLVNPVSSNRIEIRDENIQVVDTLGTYSRYSIRFSPNGEWLVNPVSSDRVEIRDENLQVVDTIGTYSYSYLQFSPTGKWLVNPVSSDNVEIRDGNLQVVDTIGTYSYSDIQFSPTGKWLINPVPSYRIEIRDENLQVVDTIGTYSRYSIRFSPDGKWLVNPVSSDSVEIRDENLQVVDTIGTYSYSCFQFSPTGKWFVNPVSSDNVEIRDGNLQVVETIETYKYSSIKFSSDGQWMLNPITAKKWELYDNRLQKMADLIMDNPRFSPNGESIIDGNFGYTIAPKRVTMHQLFNQYSRLKERRKRSISDSNRHR